MLGICVLAAGRVEAQVSQNGPYYANPSWDQELPASTRFVVLTNWSSEAVLDRETGPVWQRSPSGFSANWFDALEFCNFFTFTGNRGGWRLPSIQELQSLIDPTQRNPALPAGNPFQGVQFVGNPFIGPPPRMNKTRRRPGQCFLPPQVPPCQSLRPIRLRPTSSGVSGAARASRTRNDATLPIKPARA
jgi:hypothetical protein